MKQLSILLMNTADGFGGGEQVFVGLCSGLQAKGHEVACVVRAGGALRSVLEEAGLQVIPTQRGCGILLPRRLAKAIDSGGWQLINAHTPPDYMIAALSKELSRSKPKLIFTRHILLPLGRSFLHRWTLRSADALIAVSNAIKETLDAHPFIDPERVRTIWNGIDVEKFFPSGTRNLRDRLGIDDEGRLVGIFGEISPHKGQELFVRAANILLREGENVHFVIAGPIKQRNEAYLKKLQRLAGESGRAQS
ncbi:MAG: glycosyltransferase family 4 protein, partial [Candidatus Coatesbacteria bacterium]|nr:glycosyltransferase family 4 protein [Candidatus Coatesbacteria bacterium]